MTAPVLGSVPVAPGPGRQGVAEGHQLQHGGVLLGPP